MPKGSHLVNEPQPRPFGVYVNRWSRGEKYWFLGISVPHELLPFAEGVSPADLGQLLTEALRAERDRRHG